MNALVIGNLTIDKNLTENGIFTGPGGSSYFAAKVLSFFETGVTLISPRGKDYPDSYLEGLKIIPDHPATLKNLVFRNILKKEGRIQKVENYRENRLLVDYFKGVSSEKFNLLLVAPILNNLKASDLEEIVTATPHDLAVLMPQGLFRKVNIDGSVAPGIWNPEKVLKFFDVLILSDKDTPDALSRAKKWGGLGPVTVITEEDRGSTAFYGSQMIESPAFDPGRITDSTGAGDIFAASFAYAYLLKRDIASASEFANASAGFSLRFKKDKLQYTYSDIINFAKSQKRRINL